MQSEMPRGPPRPDEHRAAEPQPKERGCVRRGPAAAAPKPRRHPLESAASHAGNLLRLVLRAHRRAPGRILAAREDFPVVPAASSPSQRIAVAAWLLVPEGRRRKLAGGKPASAGAAPGCGVKRDMPQRGIEEAFGAVRRRGQVGPSAISQHSGPFLRCPAGARSHASPLLPGAASAADWPPANLLRRPSGTGTGRSRSESGNRKSATWEWGFKLVRLRLRRPVPQPSKILACREDFPWHERSAPTSPSSIPLPPIPLPNSAVLPGGSVPRRQPNHPCPSASGARRPGAGRWPSPPLPPFSRAVLQPCKFLACREDFPGARLYARSTSRSGLAARDASESNRCRRGFGAAAAGPRRTQPRSALLAAPPRCVHRISVVHLDQLD